MVLQLFTAKTDDYSDTEVLGQLRDGEIFLLLHELLNSVQVPLDVLHIPCACVVDDALQECSLCTKCLGLVTLAQEPVGFQAASRLHRIDNGPCTLPSIREQRIIQESAGPAYLVGFRIKLKIELPAVDDLSAVLRPLQDSERFKERCVKINSSFRHPFGVF